MTTAWCYRTAGVDCPSVPSGTNYGLPSSVVVSAPDAGTPRRSSYTYSKNGIAAAADGYFVLTTTNPLGHVTTTERRPRDGGVSRAIAPNLTSAITTKEAYGYEATTRRPSTITSTLEGEASPWTSSVSYDSNGREATLSFPSGIVVRTDYTSYGQMRQLSNNSSTAVYWTATAADAWGKVTAETFGNGLTGSHVWAASTGQAKQLQWNSGTTTPVERFDYAYDPLGNLKSQQRGSIVETYTYDARQRLTATTLSSGGGVSFGYSASGNLQRKSDFSAGGNAYSYGGNGCGPHGASSVVMPLGNTVTYACDANGNVIGGSALTATFDAENRPRTIVRSASGSGGGGGTDLIFKNGFESGAQVTGTSNATDGSMSYAYDAKGARYAEIAATRTTRYGPSGYEKVIAGTVTHRHEIGPVVIARIGSTDTVSYVLRDRLGSTIAVSNASASLTERRQFDAFGKARNADFTTRHAGQANLSAANCGFTADRRDRPMRWVSMPLAALVRMLDGQPASTV